MGLINLVNNIFSAYSIILVLYALLSWLPNAYESAIGQWIIRLSRPYLDIFDRFIPSIGGLSFNVIIAIFVLQLIRDGVIWILIRFLLLFN